MADLKIFKLSRIKFSQMLDDAKSYLINKYAQASQVFTEASPYGQLLSVILDMGKLLFYYIEDAITELNITSAVRPSSIYGISSRTGHDPIRGIAANGSINLTYNGKPIDMYGNTVIIPNGTRLKNENTTLTYTLVLSEPELRIILGKRVPSEVKIIQGNFETQTFTGTGEALQSFLVQPRKNFAMDHFQIRVFVNGEEWSRVESIYDMESGLNEEGGKQYIVKTSMTSGLDLFFGNGYFGSIPPLGSQITIEYLTNNGTQGNILMDQKPVFSFLDPGYDLEGNSLDLSEIFNINVNKEIIFGTDPEPLELTKLLAPKVSKAYVLATADSYVYFLKRFNMFSVIHAFTSKDTANLASNLIYLYLIPDVNKRKSTNDNYFTVPEHLFYLSESEKNRIYELIEQSGQQIITTVMKIIQPIISKYILNIYIIAYENYDKTTIRSQIINLMSDYFLNQKRVDRIPSSDLIKIIESIEGVDSVKVWFISKKNEENHVLKGDNIPDIGLDIMGDIISDETELPLIRGGWSDRKGVYYIEGIDENKPSCVNITFGPDTILNLNMEDHINTVKKLIG